LIDLCVIYFHPPSTFRGKQIKHIKNEKTMADDDRLLHSQPPVAAADALSPLFFF